MLCQKHDRARSCVDCYARSRRAVRWPATLLRWKISRFWRSCGPEKSRAAHETFRVATDEDGFTRIGNSREKTSLLLFLFGVYQCQSVAHILATENRWWPWLS